MTVAIARSISRWRIRVRFKLFRTSSNAGGTFTVGLVSVNKNSNGGITEISGNPLFDLTTFATGEWEDVEAYAEVVKSSASGKGNIVAGVVIKTPLTGGPAWLSCIEVTQTAAGPVSWQKTAGSAYTLSIQDVGGHIYISTGGVTVPDIPCEIGSIITIINNSGSSQTISASGITLRLAGTSTTGNRTIAAYGLCNLMKIASATWSASGAGVT